MRGTAAAELAPAPSWHGPLPASTARLCPTPLACAATPADSYNFADLSACLAASAGQLNVAQLQLVAAAAPAFQWPVYRSMPLLHAVCREAVHRSMAGTMQLPAAQRTLAAAVKGVAAMHPRLAHDLQAATCEWMRDAPTAAPAAPTAAAPAAAAPVPAEAPDCGNNAVALPCVGPTLSPLVGTTHA